MASVKVSFPSGSGVEWHPFGKLGSLPCISRLGEKLCSLNMADQLMKKVLVDFPYGRLALHGAPWKKIPYKPAELHALQKAAGQDWDETKAAQATLIGGSDALVPVGQVEKALDVLQTCCQKWKDPSSVDKFGLLKVELTKDSSFTPYIKKGNAKLVPTFYLKDEELPSGLLEENSLTLVPGWDTQYLVFCCQLMYQGGVAGKPWKVIDVQILRDAGISVSEDSWPCCLAALHPCTVKRCACQKGEQKQQAPSAEHTDSGLPSHVYIKKEAVDSPASAPLAVRSGNLPVTPAPAVTQKFDAKSGNPSTSTLPPISVVLDQLLGGEAAMNNTNPLSGQPATATPMKGVKRQLPALAPIQAAKCKRFEDQGRPGAGQQFVPRLQKANNTTIRVTSIQPSPWQPIWHHPPQPGQENQPAVPHYHVPVPATLGPLHGFDRVPEPKRQQISTPEQYSVREIPILGHMFTGVTYSVKPNSVHLILLEEIRNTFFPNGTHVEDVKKAFENAGIKVAALNKNRAEALARAGVKGFVHQHSDAVTVPNFYRAYNTAWGQVMDFVKTRREQRARPAKPSQPHVQARST